MTRSFSRSQAMLAEALGVIPLGTQTFSKSTTQYPAGVSPHFVDHARGAVVTDVDGNDYVDFNNALASVTLGHCDPDVTAAVREQLEKGTIFPLASPLEIEVAELICEMVPCAEKVRYGKNGSDATAGAIRAARAFTGRDRVATCGYHGWQDWYIGATARNKGVPRATSELTSIFAYNDASSLEMLLKAHPGEFAAIILEPMNVHFPKDDFLQQLRNLADEHGVVLVFDETITGFRYANGGAQQLFGVTPDLACFGKGLANGYPLAVIAGRRDIMAEFEEVFFSFTMGGETLSLAAAKASMTKFRDHKIADRLNETGRTILEGTQALIDKHGCGEFLSLAGHPSWSFLLIGDCNGYSSWETKTLWLQEIMERGILSLGTHNVSASHGKAEIDKLLSVYDEVFPLLREAVHEKAMAQYLRTKPLEPLFKVR